MTTFGKKTAGCVKRAIMSGRGFTIIELLVVMMIMGILFTIATISAKRMMDQSRAESQLRTMHSDLLQTRASAMQTNLQYFVVVASTNYQIYEDTNQNGTQDAPPADTLKSTVPLRYPLTGPSPDVTITIDSRGLITMSTVTSDSAWPAALAFTTADSTPEYDCFQFYPTRMNLGKMKDGSCNAR